MVAIWRRGNIGKCRGEIFFAHAKGDARHKWSGGYAPPMADFRAKNISPLQMDDRVCEKVCEHIDDWQRPGRLSGAGVTTTNVGAKNISPVPKMMWGRNGQAVTRHQWPISGRKIFRPDKWMIGDAKRFAYVWTGIVPRCGNQAHFGFAALDTVRSFT